jgi:predicted nucleotide-binding protein
MVKPSLFVGSSTEGLEFARAVRAELEADVEVTLWNDGFFELGSTFIETLLNALPRFDFGVLVLTSDDWVSSRDVTTFGPRDNVIFELGAMGCYRQLSVNTGRHSATNLSFRLTDNTSGEIDDA